MTDWVVKVVTQNNQVKDVRITDCIYPMDAVEAAMSQTAAKSMISCSPVFDKPEPVTTSQVEQGDNWAITYSPPQPEEWRSRDTYSYWTTQFLWVTIIPTVALLIINPFLAIIFNICLGYWWFHDLKCDK